MRNLKKFLALVLAMMMTMSLMLTVNAATSSEDLNLTDSESVSEAFLEDIQVLTGMEVIKGYPDGSFKPATEINRHQMATFIYRMTTGDTGDLKDRYLSEIAAEKFPDVKAEDSYAGYIGYCWVNGYIQGFPDGNGGYVFKPMNKLTGYQALVMILRAMGYNNPNDNFTGSDWQSLALSRARMNNLLVNIDKTVYNGTFSRPAPRELVAEMVFQGLIQPQVTYTPAMGYQKYGMEGGVLSNVLNPTLGEAYFGLTNNKGIVVGNQATGEGSNVTKIGFALDSAAVRNWGNLNITTDPVDGTIDAVTGALTQVGLNAAISDEVTKAGKAYVYDSDTGVALPENVTLAFKWETHLDQFGHAVDVWYDSRSNETVTVGADKTSGQVKFPTNLNTYAVFDRVNTEATRVVAAPNANLGSANNDATLNETLGEVLGYTTNDTTAARSVYWNYAFGPTRAKSMDTNGADVNIGDADAAVDFTSPVLATDTATNNGLYLVISNNAAGAPDLIVSLDVTFTKVVQDNNTTAPLTTGILTQNSDDQATDHGYFDQHSPDLVNPSTMAINSSITPYNYSNVANTRMVDSDAVALRDYVSALTITGTNGIGVGGTNTGAEVNNTTPTTGEIDFGNAPAVTGISSTYYYQMNKLDNTTTGNAWKYDRVNQDVTLEDGRTLHRSVFADAVDASFLADLLGMDPSNPQPTDSNYASAHDEVVGHTNAPIATGAYTFYLDENGDYIFWTVANERSATFVYGTYIDWATRTSTGLFNYPMSYVDSTGKGGQLVNVTHVYDENLAAVSGASIISQNVTRPFGGDMDNDLYTEEIQLPKRTVMVDGGSAGYVRGTYVGYLLGANGSITAVTPDANDSGFVQATSDNYDFGHGDITISSGDALIGAKPVGVEANQSNLFLTNDTKFVIVNGAGMDADGVGTQTVKVLTGLEELVEEYRSNLVIKSNTGFTDDKYLVDSNATTAAPTAPWTNPWTMIYYTSKTFDYSQTYDPSAKAVETVFIPEQLIQKGPATGTDTTEVVFIGDNTPGMINTTGDGWATQFTVYGLDGTEKEVWIDGRWQDDTTSDAYLIANTGNAIVAGMENTFIKLKQTDKVTNYGQPVYELADLTATEEGVLIGYYLDDVDGTPARTKCTLGCADNAGMDTEDTYLPTTYSSQVAYITGRQDGDLYNVGRNPAKVVNLDTATYTINNLNDLNNAGQLTSNTGIPVSCVVNGTNKTVVETIFVNFPT